jgi:hypothetical protein
MTFTIAKDGEWLQPVLRGYRVKCCDCSLVHVLDFRIVGKQVQFKARRCGRGKRK